MHHFSDIKLFASLVSQSLLLVSISFSELVWSRFLRWTDLNIVFLVGLVSTLLSLLVCPQSSFLCKRGFKLPLPVWFQTFCAVLLSVSLSELARSQPRLPHSLLRRTAPAGNLPNRPRRPVLKSGLRRRTSAGALRLKGLEGVAADGIDEGEKVLLHSGGVVLQATAGALGGLLAAHCVAGSFGRRSSSACGCGHHLAAVFVILWREGGWVSFKRLWDYTI